MRYRRPCSYLVLIVIVLGAPGAAARIVCSPNRADCLDLPLEWERQEEGEGLMMASRFVDDDKLTLTLIETTSGYWEQSIQDYLRPLKKKGGLREYDTEEITAGDIKYTAYAYEAFGRRFKSGVSRRMDFYVYRKGSIVRIVLFSAAGGTFIKMGYEIEEILSSAVFPDPKSMGEKKGDSQKEDDGWGEYGYKPAQGSDTALSDNYGWGDNEENSENRENRENDVIDGNEELSGFTSPASLEDLDSSMKSLVSPESELKKKWLSFEENLSYSELEKRRLSLEKESMGEDKKRDWLHDDSAPFEKSEEADKFDFFPSSYASDNQDEPSNTETEKPPNPGDGFGGGFPDKTDDGW